MRPQGLAVVGIVGLTALLLSASFYVSLRHSTVVGRGGGGGGGRGGGAGAEGIGIDSDGDLGAWRDAVEEKRSGDSVVVAEQRKQITRLLQQIEVSFFPRKWFISSMY